VAQQQAKNAAELAHQIQVNQAIGAENAKLQADNAAADERMRGLLLALASHGSGSMPPAAPGASGTAITGNEPDCTEKLTGLVERTADLADSARADSTELSLLQEWASKSGLMH
jgi:hypothetical protein